MGIENVKSPQDIVDDKDISIQSSMYSEGENLTQEDDSRLSVSANPIIPNRIAHDAWMSIVYNDTDAGIISTPKPPSTERQMLPLEYDDIEQVDMLYYLDGFDFKWRIDIQGVPEKQTGLTLYIFDDVGAIISTTGTIAWDPIWESYHRDMQAPFPTTPAPLYYKIALGSVYVTDMLILDTPTVDGEENGSAITLSIRSNPEVDQ